MRSADPGGRAGGCIGRAPAESGTRKYCGSVVVAPAVSAGAIFTCVNAMRIYVGPHLQIYWFADFRVFSSDYFEKICK